MAIIVTGVQSKVKVLITKIKDPKMFMVARTSKYYWVLSRGQDFLVLFAPWRRNAVDLSEAICDICG
jgi:hypothetical protein